MRDDDSDIEIPRRRLLSADGRELPEAFRPVVDAIESGRVPTRSEIDFTERCTVESGGRIPERFGGWAKAVNTARDK